MQDTYDPFSYLLSEIRAHDQGLRYWPPGQRQHYLDQLRADEAQEIAWGRRHLTLVHGPITDPEGAAILETIVADLATLVAGQDWYRFSGLPDHHLTLTVEGPDADNLVGLRAHLAATRARPAWRLITSPVVEVTP